MLTCRCNKGTLVTPPPNPTPFHALSSVYFINTRKISTSITITYKIIQQILNKLYYYYYYYYYYLLTNIIFDGWRGWRCGAFQEKFTVGTYFPPGGYREQTSSWKARAKGDSNRTKHRQPSPCCIIKQTSLPVWAGQFTFMYGDHIAE